MNTRDPLLVRAYSGESVERIPVWMMRQAGRYLPEYREIRSRMSMLEAIKNPKIAAEITLQPIRRFEPDGAIIFADILNPLIGLGFDLDFIEGEGPKISNPIRTGSDVQEMKTPKVRDNVGYTLDALAICANELSSRKVALLGFAGAPFTLANYLIEGRAGQSAEHVKRFMLTEPKAWELLQERLADMTIDYLIAQAEAGAQALQLFDSWIGHLGPHEFERSAAPQLKRIISTVQREAGVPVVYFGTGTAGIFGQLAELGANVLGVDWRMSISAARELTGDQVTLQGNLDPSILAGPQPYLLERAQEILSEGSFCRPYVFNLGHGVLPHTPIENVAAVIDLVKDFRPAA